MTGPVTNADHHKEGKTVNISLIAVATCLVILLSTAQGESSEIGLRLAGDSMLLDAYGGVCTSINGVDFNSLSKPEVSFQKRIDVAEDNATIFIPPGHYDLSEPLHIHRNITAIGSGSVVVDAQRACEILHIEDSNLSVRIENINFVNGEGDHGGAIDSVAKSLTLVNCTFGNNIAEEGATVYSNRSDLHIVNSSIIGNLGFDSIVASENGTLILENVSFTNNSAFKFCDGINISGTGRSLDPQDIFDDDAKGIYSDGLNLVIRNCTFSNNHGYATSGERGGYGISIIRAIDINMLIKDSKFDSNAAEMNSGAIYAHNCSTVMTNCRICNNMATMLGIGCGVLFSSGNSLMNRCEISGNQLPREAWWSDVLRGGGIATSFNASVTLTGCKVDGNKGRLGAGIYNEGTLVLKDSIVSGNVATEKGGAIFNTGAGRIEITNTPFTGNTAPEGANVFNEAPGIVIYHVDDDRGEHIQGAIDTAPPGSFIDVAPGLYPENLHIDTSLNISGSGDTVIDGMKLAPVIVLGKDSWQVNNSSVRVSLSNLTIQNGSDEKGAGVQNWAHLVLDNVDIRNNKAIRGGGVWNFQRGTVDMNSGNIHDNVATGMGGGGVFNKGIFNLNGGSIYQ